MKENVIRVKTLEFAKRIVRLSRYLEQKKMEFVLSKQVMRSGTAPGALVRESEHAESKKDFLHKLSIALKEANETEYWLLLIKEGGFISLEEFESIHSDCLEIIKILAAIVKKLKSR